MSDLYKFDTSTSPITRYEWDDGQWLVKPLKLNESLTSNADGTFSLLKAYDTYVKVVTYGLTSDPADDPAACTEISEQYQLPGSSTVIDPVVSQPVNDGIGDDQDGDGLPEDHLQGSVGNDLEHGGAGDDTLEGGDGNDRLYGDEGDDDLNGGNGNDVMYAGVGFDLLSGGAGNDQLFGEADDDIINGNDGTDSLNGGAGDDELDGGADNDTLTGGDGLDTLLGGDGADSLGGGMSADDLEGGNGNDKLDGGDGNDTLVGDAGADSLLGGNGNDLLYSGTGNDTVMAGAGDDLIIGGDGQGDDVYNGEAGIDTVKYTSAVAGITIDLAKGSAKSTLVDAGIGTDTLKNIESVIAGDFNDVLKGSSGANKLEGGSGDDLLLGGGGKDTLVGGAGNDTFKFLGIGDAGKGNSRDVILDFASGDKIDLSAIDAKSGFTGNDAFTFLASAPTSKAAANGALWFDAGAHILYGSVNADTKPEFAIELAGVSSLTASDIIL